MHTHTLLAVEKCVYIQKKVRFHFQDLLEHIQDIILKRFNERFVQTVIK